MMQWLAIAAGGALGSLGRFVVAGYVTSLLNIRFPMGTLAVNITGAFLIGVAYVLLVEKAASGEWQLFFITGLLGGFTTFSAFSLETLQLLQDGAIATALGYVVSSVMICLLAVFLGVLLAQKF